MTQIFTGTGLGTHGSSLGQLGSYGPKGTASLGSGGGSVYVNAANGNLVLKQTDGFLSDLSSGMDLFQTYNSRNGNGNSWRFNFESHLSFEGKPNTAGSVIKRIDEDGHVSRFIYNTQQQKYLAEDGSSDRIIWKNNSWQYQEGSGQTQLNYTAEGQLFSLTDKDGHRLAFSYKDGKLSHIIDTSGKQNITWSFSCGLLRDVTFTSENNTIHHLHYDYDSQNRLTKVSRTLDNGHTYWISYAYAGDSNLISDVNQSDGTKLHIDYDAEGRVKQLIDGEGRSTSYAYYNGKTVVTNNLGESWSYYYDEQARLTGIDGPENFHVRYTYQGKNLVAVTQGNQIWRFAYNEAGDCISITMPSGELIHRIFDAEHRLLNETRYQSFDGERHPGSPQTSRYIYDEKGHLRFVVKADGTVTEHRYDNDGLLISTRTYLRGHMNVQSLDETKVLSMDELTLWTKSQNQQAVSLVDYQYDWRGNLIQEIHYAQVDEQGVGIPTKDALTTYSRFDAAGRLVEKSSVTDSGLSTTHYFYDALGRLIRTIDNQQHETCIEYDDEHHRVIKTDANGLKTISTYDKSGLLLCTQRLDQNHDYGQTIYRYDSASRLISETDTTGKTTYFFYDAQGRVKARVAGDGHVTEYTYDEDDHCIATREFLNKIDTKGFQEHFPLWATIRPAISNQDRVSQVVYNEYGEIAYQINSEGAVIAYKYDAEGRVIAKTAYANRLSNFSSAQLLFFSDVVLLASSKDRTINYYYDPEGRLQGEINGEGAATSYKYDALGHVIEMCRYANYAKPTRSGIWSIDAPDDAKNKDIKTFTLYNAAGFKVADIDAEGYLTEYSYDSRGLFISSTSYYTAIGRLLVIDENTTLDSIRPPKHTNDHKTQFKYNDLNQLIEERKQNGLVITYAYDESGLVVNKTSTDIKTHEARQQRYRYDALGRITQSLNAVGAALLQNAGSLTQEEIEKIWQQNSIKYTYDNAGRLLTQTDALNQTTHYFYNAEGLLMYSLSPSGVVNETRYNPFSQVETIIRYSAFWPGKTPTTSEQLQQFLISSADSRFDEITIYKYNSIGLVTSKTQGSGSQLTTSYNAFGELEQSLKRIDQNHESITSYDYDRQGLLQIRTEDLGGINKTFEIGYDAFGRMIYSFDAQHTLTKYRLNKRGEATLIFNPVKIQKEMAYDAFGRVISLVDKIENAYSYDDQTNTFTVTNIENDSSIVTAYNAFGDKISVTDGNLNKTTFIYDANGKLTHVDAPEGKAIDYRYDTLGRLIFEQKSNGKIIQYTYDAEDHVLSKIIDPDGLKITSIYTYDGVGRELSVNEAGRITQFTYDNQGNLIKKCIDPQGLHLIIEYSYTLTGLLERQTEYSGHGLNKITAYTWDALGRCLSTTVDSDGLALSTYYQYDNNDNLICKIDALNNRTQYLYDADNQMRYQIDARGVVTEYKYDGKGNKIQSTIYANRVDASKNFDEKSILLSIRQDAQDQCQFYSYDKLARLIWSYDSKGYATEYIYDANNNLISKIARANACSLTELKNNFRPKPAHSPADRFSYFAYDGLNQQRYQIDSNGRLTEYRYNNAGDLIQQIRYAHSLDLKEMKDDYSLFAIETKKINSTQLDQTTNYTYDQAGRLLAQTSPAGSIIAYQYDKAGNVIATTRYATPITKEQLQNENWFSTIKQSPNDRITRAIFDAAGREIYRISPSGKVVGREYDAAGNVISERIYAKTYTGTLFTQEELTKAMDAAQQESTQYQYDALGRLLTKTDALNHQTSYTYDSNNNVLSKTDANHARWTYTYDASNQLIETIAPESTVCRYQGSQLIEEKRSIKTVNEYDSFGNLIKVIRDADYLKQTVNYVYDENNKKIATIYPDVSINAASKSASSTRQEEIKTLKETNVYNAFGELIQSTDKAGNTKHWVYDLCGRVAYVIDAKNGTTQYEYDAFDNVAQKTTFANPLTLTTGAEYTPEAVKNAIQVSKYDRHETYTYDKDAHLLQTQKDLVNSYNSRTGEYEIEGVRPTTQYTYNAFGELVQTAVQLNKSDWAISTTYYNNEGLKTAQINAEGYLITYEYDDFCRLATQTEYAERNTGRTLNQYGLPPASTKDRKVNYLYDALGRLTSKTLINASYDRLTGNGSRYEKVTGDLISSYKYDALGNLLSTTDPQGNTVYSYYNELGQQIAKVGVQTKAGRSATTYGYDALGNLLEIRQWAKGAAQANEDHFTLAGSSDKDIITHDVYDAQGHLTQQTDGTGHQINYSYDAQGSIARRWQVLQQVDGTSIVQDKRYTYDAENHLTQTATIKSKGEYATEDAQYNAFGEVSAKGVDGVFSKHIDYDNAGRVWRSNLEGYYQIYLYDLTGNITQVVTSTNAFGAEFDENGVDLSRSIYEDIKRFNEQSLLYDLQRQDNVYDALGRLIKQIKDGSGTISDRDNKVVVKRATQESDLDCWGNVIRHQNANGYSTLYDFNVFNQVTKQTLPQVKVVDEHGVAKMISPELFYAYDALGRVIAMTDANGHTSAKVLDAEGHITREIDALGQHRDKEYDLLGQMERSINERGFATQYTYDKANRLLSIKSSNLVKSYAYDGAGQLIKQTEGEHSTANETNFWYDALGNQIQREHGGHKCTYEYDDAGHKIKETDAKGNTQTWAYDQNGRVIEHTDLGGHITKYTYNKNGLLLTEQSTAGKNKVYHYYSDGQLWQYDDRAKGEVVTFEYDAQGNVMSKESSQTGGWILETDHYAYDALGRLVEVKRRNPDDPTKGTPDPKNALLSIDYEYDAAGNIRDTKVMTHAKGHNQVNQTDYYTYDENNRIKISKGQLQNGQIVTTATQGSELAYDSAGNIISAQKYEKGVKTNYTYAYTDDNQVKLVRKNNMDFQTKIYNNAGNVIEENLYNTLGIKTQHNITDYKNGLVAHSRTLDANEQEVSKTQYEYDAADNLEKLTTQGTNNKQTHNYTYEKWESYQQSEDRVSYESNGNPTATGKSVRSYDVNGQLQRSTDTNGDNSVEYLLSSLDGIRARKEKDSQTSYLTVAGKTIGDLKTEKNGATHLEVYGGFTPTGMPEEGKSMMPSMWTEKKGPQGLFFPQPAPKPEATGPNAPQDNLGTYTLQTGDSLESIALQVYGDSSLWYLIADANGITDKSKRASEAGSQMQAGQRLNIPPASGSHHTSGTHKTLNGNEVLGNTSATATATIAPSTPITQTKRKNSPWRMLAMAAVAIIATVATVFTAGAFAAVCGVNIAASGGLLSAGIGVLGGGSLGLIQTVGIGFAAGFVGSVAGQAMATTLDLQEGIDFKGALLTGIGTAATAGVSNLLAGSSAYQGLVKAMDTKSTSFFKVSSAAEMMERDLVSQSINLTARRQQHLDWLELSVSAATAGFIASDKGIKLNQTIEKTFKKASSTVSSELQSLTTSGITSAVTGAHFDAGQVLADNLGGAVGGNVLESISKKEQNMPENHKVDLEKSLDEDIINQPYLSDTVLDIIDSDRTIEEVYHNSVMQKLDDKRGYGVFNNIDIETTSKYSSIYGSELRGFIENVPKTAPSKLNLDKLSPQTKYIVELYPYTYAASKETGLSHELMLAQGAQETGWGVNVLVGTNNMFNIKNSKEWTGPVKILNGAMEYSKDGKKSYINSEFRVYSSIEESVKDRTKFFKDNKRYTELFNPDIKGNLVKEAYALQKAQYAGHNPYYAEYLIKVANGPSMRKALDFARTYYGY